jgi:hypothetical protein
MLDHKHCRAICDEIGDRLRYALQRETSEIPPRLLALIDQLARLENDDPARLQPSPSLAPSIAEMVAMSITPPGRSFQTADLQSDDARLRPPR